MNGFINILKPSGMNSNYAVTAVRRLLGKGIKTGHMGTLDPAAAGVLPIGVGFAVRLFDYVIDKEKEYVCEASFGIRTDTQDAEGRITSQCDAKVALADILRLLPSFSGDITQTPPAYSAVVKNGRKLYSIARSGGDTCVEQRRAHVRSIEVIGEPAPNRFLFKIVCGRGTYVRTILSDMGDALGCGAYCSFLLRTRAGCFTLDNSRMLDELSAEHFPLLPIDLPLGHLPALYADDSLRGVIRNGAPTLLSDFSCDSLPAQDQTARVYLSEEFVGLGKRQGDVLRFVCLKPAQEI